MKIVFSLLVAAAAAAQSDFSDDVLTLIQLRNAKHPKHDHQSHEEALLNAGKIRMGGAQEEADQAQQDAEDALAVANNALNEAFQAEDDAQAAQDDAAAEAAGAVAPVDPNPGQEDEAEAVGDPHLKLSNGKKADLCCNGGHCKPCDASLFQHDQDQNEGKMGGAQEEAEQAQNEADEAQDQISQAIQQAQDAQAEAQQAEADAAAEAANPGQQAEAEAVGDPHMKLSNGKKADLCCDGHRCKKCPDSTLLQHDKKKGEGKTNGALADALQAGLLASMALDAAQQASGVVQALAQFVTNAVDDLAPSTTATPSPPPDGARGRGSLM